MKKMMRSTFGRLFNKNWVLAATLVCGASVFTSCSNDNSDNAGSIEQAKNNRKEFVAHTRQNLKTLAENLNFSTWNSVNTFNQCLNEYVLLNDNFDKTLSRTVGMEAQKSLQLIPVEYAEMPKLPGKKYMAFINIADFDYIFKMTANGFDVTPNPEDGLVIEMVDPYYPQYAVMIGLKGSGDEHLHYSEALSNDSVAVFLSYSKHYDFVLSTKQDGEWIPGIVADADLTIQQGEGAPEGMPEIATYMFDDAWNLKGTVQTSIPGDATAMEFNIGQDPTQHKGGMTFDFTHNGQKTVGLRAVLTNTNGITDFTQLNLNSASSLLDVITAVMAGKSIDDLTLTLLDDLTTTVKVADCQKVMTLQSEMATARRNYADQKTIDAYTQQLNELVSATITCKGVNQEIPMRLVTTKFGVDWWSMPSFNFADENGYVPMTELLDAQSVQYGINIIDHAAEPMQQAIIVVRQLAQALLKLQSAFLQTKPAE